jgi:hypothetical protein
MPNTECGVFLHNGSYSSLHCCKMTGPLQAGICLECHPGSAHLIAKIVAFKIAPIAPFSGHQLYKPQLKSVPVNWLSAAHYNCTGVHKLLVHMIGIVASQNSLITQ